MSKLVFLIYIFILKINSVSFISLKNMCLFSYLSSLVISVFL